MKIVNIPINELRGSEYNPRMIGDEQFEQLKASIEKFQFVEPIVVNAHQDRANIIIGGHQRWEAAKALGMETVPVYYVTLDEEKERELNLRLNKNTGTWDYDLLANNFDVDLLRSVGFTDAELGLGEEVTPVPQPDDEFPKKTIECPKCGHQWEV